MRLSNGRPAEGVGGGLCQLANLVHWLVLHSPLTVVERSQHTFDPFPDNDRVVPWGVGCSIVYNYVDLVVRNETDATFELRAWVGEQHLHGQLLSDHQPEHRGEERRVGAGLLEESADERAAGRVVEPFADGGVGGECHVVLLIRVSQRCVYLRFSVLPSTL